MFDSDAKLCKVYQGNGIEVLSCEMHDGAVNGPGFGFRGRCPRGTWKLGLPVDVDEPSLGLHFTPLLNIPGRHGIGIHGGGSGLYDPFAARQGWVVTFGCLRVQNDDNAKLVDLIRSAHHYASGDCWITVQGQ